MSRDKHLSEKGRWWQTNFSLPTVNGPLHPPSWENGPLDAEEAETWRKTLNGGVFLLYKP